MPIVGERKSLIGRGYETNPLFPYIKEFTEVISHIRENAIDIFTESSKIGVHKGAYNALKDFFVEQAFDELEYKNSKLYNDGVSKVQEKIEELSELYENQVEAMGSTLTEHTSLNAMNPLNALTAMSLPIYKLNMVNNIYEKILPSCVSVAPKFTTSFEHRILIDKDGNEIDMAREQEKIYEMVEGTNPYTTIELTLPEKGETNLLEQVNGIKGVDNIDRDIHICAYLVDVPTELISEESDSVDRRSTEEKWINCRILINQPGYGDSDKAHVQADINLKKFGIEENDYLAGVLHKNVLKLNSTNGLIKKVRLKLRKCTSSGQNESVSVAWKYNTQIEDIPTASYINMTISPEEVKDISALYDTNQLTKISSMIYDVVSTHKDDKIREGLKESYETLEDRDKVNMKFDFVPKEGYFPSNPAEWRHNTFFDILDTAVTHLLQALNDPNMSIAIVGKPEIIRKITPTTYDYQTPNSVGTIDLEYTKTIFTNNNRLYQLASTQKIKDNTLQILLIPRNNSKIIYRVVNYHSFITNEIRNVKNPALPATTYVDRWLFNQYNPVQGKIEILNPSGIPDSELYVQ